MTDLIFNIAPQVVLGSYTIARLGQFVLDWGTRYMVIMDPGLKSAGASKKVLSSLAEHDVRYFIIDDLYNGAETEVVRSALTLSRNAHIQGVIAAGGPKAINIGRTVASLFNEKKTVYDIIDTGGTSAPPLPFICVPTSLQDSFMFTNWIPLIDARSRRIKLIKIQSELSKLILHDPYITREMTQNELAAISLQTLCIAFEGLISQKATFFSDMLIEKSLNMIAQNLPSAEKTEGADDEEIDETAVSVDPQEMIFAQCSFLATLGSALSSPGAATLLALGLNARYKIPSAFATAALFPHLIADAANYKLDKIEHIVRMLRLDSVDSAGNDRADGKNAAAVFKKYIEERLTSAAISAHLKDQNLSIEQIALVAGDIGNLEFMNTLSRSMTPNDLFNLAKQAY